MSKSKLRKLRIPKKQVSEMSDEELANYHEPGIKEEGFVETAENFLMGGQEPDSRAMMVSPGKVEAQAEKAASGLINRLRKAFPKDKLDEIAEEVRTTGKADIFDESGKLVATIGGDDARGKALKQLAKENLAVKELDAPVYSASGTIGGAARRSFVPRDRGPKGEALEFMQRTGVDPTRKTGYKALSELQKKRKLEQEEALRSLKPDSK